jgi:plasmid stabilization system protein ParE
MGSKSFQFHPEAREEFRSSARWYRTQNPLVSSEFRLAVSGGIRLIVQAPQRWPGHLHGTRRFVIYRFPYSVIYLDDLDLVTILAIAHSKRRPGYWKDRL